MRAELTKFVVKVLVIFVIWYMIYELWLLPDGRMDEWLSLNIVGVSAGFLNWLGFDPVFIDHRVIGVRGYPGIHVLDGCNGIAAMGLFMGFILAYPGAGFLKFPYLCIGICAIYLVNILRIMILVVTQVYWSAFFELTHDYSTTAIFYIVIFMLWVIWVKLIEWGDIEEWE